MGKNKDGGQITDKLHGLLYAGGTLNIVPCSCSPVVSQYSVLVGAQVQVQVQIGEVSLWLGRKNPQIR